ncbi:MAG: TerB family tellurite resistance protein [Alphaproteobacteria bacterium]|nr:TerB family tellurite resistance protein [Alphaproteobacteria bacterium]
MSDINNIIPSYLDSATIEEKTVFFRVLFHLADSDGITDENELEFIRNTAKKQGIEDLEELQNLTDEAKILQDVKIIKNRHLALELIREMCMLSHVDNILSDQETLFIGKVGIALGVEMEKIEQISNWVIDHIFWREQAKYIFEER